MNSVKLLTTSSYAAVLRPALKPRIFSPAPLRLLWLPVHYAVLAFGGLVIVRNALPLPLQVVVSLLIGASFAGLTFVGHEALHGAIVRGRTLRRIVGRLGFLPFCVPPSLWEAWHNRVHHGNTNRSGVDPDTYPTLAEYNGSALLRRATDWVSPGRSRVAGIFSLLVGFSIQSSHMLLTAKRRKFLTQKQHYGALLEAVACWVLWGGVAFAVGPAAFLLCFGLPLLVGNAIIMSFILTNHNLSPQTPINDPLVNSLSVSGPRFFDWLTLGFGFHVEHHLFPAMSGRYARELSREVRSRWPERYQRLPYFQALLLLHRSPRVYQTDTVLCDPAGGTVWPTLTPTCAEASSASTHDDLPNAATGSSAARVAAARGGAIALSFTASMACSAPVLRAPPADEPMQRAPEAEQRAIAIHPASEADGANPVDAHHAPPATTSTAAPSLSVSDTVDKSALDADIEQRILHALQGGLSPSFDLNRIEIVSRRGKVVLSGPVDSELERTTIEKVVSKIPGIVQIDSRLFVAHP